jgi:predicted NUDIX family phosphoesterase
MGDQPILCVERAVLECGIGRSVPKGLTCDQALFHAVTDLFVCHGKFLPRRDVEEDPTFLQPIVYGVVTDGQRVLALWRKERLSPQGRYVEARHNRKIGLASGGHVEPLDDLTHGDFSRRAMHRELSEELIFAPSAPPPSALQPVGMLMREETVFDRVHLGLMYRVPLSGSVSLPAGSDEYDRIMLLSPEEFLAYRDDMEGWGKTLADTILAGRFPLRAPVSVSAS